MGFAMKAINLADLRLGYIKARKLHPLADHIAAAYLLPFESGFQDDKEVSSGWRMLEILKETVPADTAVFLVRFYGGDKLGKRRFELIEQAVKEALFRLP